MIILIANAYRCTSSETLCILAGTTQIIKVEEAAKHYDVWKCHRANMQNVDREVGLNKWPNPTDFINFPETEGCDEQIFGSTMTVARISEVCYPGW